MATLSIMKNIRIKNKKVSLALVNALDYSKNKQSKNVVLKRSLEELKGEDIKKLFEEKGKWLDIKLFL